MAPQIKKSKTAFLFFQSDQLAKIRKENNLGMGDAMTEVSLIIFILFYICLFTSISHCHCHCNTGGNVKAHVIPPNEYTPPASYHQNGTRREKKTSTMIPCSFLSQAHPPLLITLFSKSLLLFSLYNISSTTNCPSQPIATTTTNKNSLLNDGDQ
jgi:hypothetical protein